MEQEQTQQPQNDDVTEINPPLRQEEFDLSTLSTDLCSAKIISSAYAGRDGELSAILQYLYQTINFDMFGYTNIANQLKNIAIQEMKHFELLGKTLIRLGANPIYTRFPPIRDNYFTTRYVNYINNPKQMLSISLNGEKCAIKEYDCMIQKLKNQTVINIIQSIKNQEEEHVKILENLLNTF